MKVTAGSGIFWNFPVVAGPECIESTLTSLCPPLCPACYGWRKGLFSGERCLVGRGLNWVVAKIVFVKLLVVLGSPLDITVLFSSYKVCLTLNRINREVRCWRGVGGEVGIKC
jgi:hypothetical protein